MDQARHSKKTTLPELLTTLTKGWIKDQFGIGNRRWHQEGMHLTDKVHNKKAWTFYHMAKMCSNRNGSANMMQHFST